jgi:hypothetical protein
MQPLCWPNTFKLTLSIQHASELELLLQHNSLPSIEHLEVTNEYFHFVLPTDNEKSILNIQSNDVRLRRERIDGIRLRYLLLRYINLIDFITLIDSLTMPVLETLILVDMYDHSKLLLDFIPSIIQFCLISLANERIFFFLSRDDDSIDFFERIAPSPQIVFNIVSILCLLMRTKLNVILSCSIRSFW